MDLTEALANYEPPAEEAPTGMDEPGSTSTNDVPTVATESTTAETGGPAVAPGGVPPVADLFSPEALATPQGIAAAQTELKRLVEEARTKRQKIDSKESKFETTKQRWISERNAFQAEKQQLLANLNTLRTAPYDQRLMMLSQLLGDAPHEVVRGLNLAALKKGPAPDKVATLESTVAELQKQLQSRTAAEERARLEQQEEAKYRAELPQDFKTPQFQASFPSITAYLSDPAYPGNLPEVVDYVVKLRQDYFRETGHPLKEELAFMQVEHQLARLPKPAPATPPAAVAPATQAPSPPSKSPVAPATGQSLTASDLTASHSRREMSEQESIEAIANDPDALAFLQKSGLIRL